MLCAVKLRVVFDYRDFCLVAAQVDFDCPKCFIWLVSLFPMVGIIFVIVSLLPFRFGDIFNVELGAPALQSLSRFCFEDEIYDRYSFCHSPFPFILIIHFFFSLSLSLFGISFEMTVWASGLRQLFLTLWHFFPTTIRKANGKEREMTITWNPWRFFEWVEEEKEKQE